jgi:hypothetical protein
MARSAILLLQEGVCVRVFKLFWSEKSFFVWFCEKSDRYNIGNDELRELRKLSQLFLGLKDDELTSALEIDRIEEIQYHD